MIAVPHICCASCVMRVPLAVCHGFCVSGLQWPIVTEGYVRYVSYLVVPCLMFVMFAL